MCERSTAYLSGLQVTNSGVILYDHFKLPCNSFQCKECAPYKTRELRARVYNGIGSDPAINQKYGAKFFTFTYCGSEHREIFTPAQALDQMQANWTKMTKCLRKQYGKENLGYMRVTEPQKDGYPHYHVLFIGRGSWFREKGFLRLIESMWCDRYKMGFIKGKVIHGFQHGVNYVTKYLTKGMQCIKKYQRLFSASIGALAKKIKKQTKWIGFRHMVFGGCESSGMQYEISRQMLFDIGIDLDSGGVIDGNCYACDLIKGYEDIKELVDLIKE